jgi:hypothetical protein
LFLVASLYQEVLLTVTSLTRRLRSLLVALAVLALSAGAVLAGRSALSAPIHPDRTVAHAEGSDTETGETEETEPAEAPETETDADETPDTETDAPGGDTSAAVHPDNHGKLVSEAAQAPTPADATNHGQFVRTIAQDNHGKATAAAAKAKHTAPTNTH